jgi:hypothetical protein
MKRAQLLRQIGPHNLLILLLGVPLSTPFYDQSIADIGQSYPKGIALTWGSLPTKIPKAFAYAKKKPLLW